MKQYRIRTEGVEHTLPIETGTSNTYITFEKEEKNTKDAFYSSNDKELCEHIEKSSLYKKGIIKLVFDTEENEVDTATIDAGDNRDEPVVYDKVKTFKEAKEILTAAPYNVPISHLGNGEKIMKKANELGVSFPNLRTD